MFAPWARSGTIEWQASPSRLARPSVQRSIGGGRPRPPRFGGFCFTLFPWPTSFHRPEMPGPFSLVARRGAALPPPPRLSPERPATPQHPEEIGPIHGEVGIPVALDRDGAEIEQLPGLAGTPEPDFLAGRLAGKQFKLVADAQLMKHARAVRSELQSGAHFLQLRRLF